MNLETTLEDVVPVVPDPAQRAQEVDKLVKLSRLGGKRELGPAGPWEVVNGQRIVFSAPHEATHYRDGVKKIAEQGTGSLALALARYVGGTGISTVPEQNGDPNWDLDNAYVKRTESLAGSGPTVDLHMMRPRGVDICIGLGPVPELAQELWSVFVGEAVAAGLRVSLNWPFGGNPRTVTGQLQRRGRKAIQLELTWECFDPNHPAMARSWSSLARAVHRLTSV